MCHSNNHYIGFAGQIENVERESLKNELVCSMVGRDQKPCAILSTMEQQELIEKIKRLPQDSVAEVEDFLDSLTRRERSLNRISLHQALTNYAIQHAGTNADLDPDLEASASDHLLQQN